MHRRISGKAGVRSAGMKSNARSLKCAFPLSGLSLQTFQPLVRVVLAFSSVDLALGTIVTGSLPATPPTVHSAALTKRLAVYDVSSQDRGGSVVVVAAQQIELAQFHIKRLPRQPEHFGGCNAVVHRQLYRGFDAHLFHDIGGFGDDLFQ